MDLVAADLHANSISARRGLRTKRVPSECRSVSQEEPAVWMWITAAACWTLVAAGVFWLVRHQCRPTRDNEGGGERWRPRSLWSKTR